MARNKNLGKKAEDKITGFTGTVTGYVQYITGCDQYLITPACKKDNVGSYPNGTWVDENRLTFLKSNKITINTDTKKGPMERAPIK